jgi:hypothetical protein
VKLATQLLPPSNSLQCEKNVWRFISALLLCRLRDKVLRHRDNFLPLLSVQILTYACNKIWIKHNRFSVGKMVLIPKI